MQTRFFYIRKVRCNMTLKQVAEKTGIPLASVVKYDNGDTPIENAAYKRVIAFSNLFKCKPDELIGYIE